MANLEVLICTGCGQRYEKAEKHLLATKTILFTSVSGQRGQSRKVLRKRAIAFLCPRCLAGDPEYNLPEFVGAPGTQETKYGRQHDHDPEHKTFEHIHHNGRRRGDT